jgi:hypothetical protein
MYNTYARGNIWDMAKKLLIVLALSLVLIGGFFALRQYLDYQAHQTYLKSPRKVADDIVGYLKANNAKAAYGQFTDAFKADYSEAYWEKQFFPQFKNASISEPKTSEQVKQQPNKPPAYPQDVEAWRFVYLFKLNDVDYELTIVAARKGDNPWRVNELFGSYKVARQ